LHELFRRHQLEPLAAPAANLARLSSPWVRSNACFCVAFTDTDPMFSSVPPEENNAIGKDAYQF